MLAWSRSAWQAGHRLHLPARPLHQPPRLPASSSDANLSDSTLCRGGTVGTTMTAWRCAAGTRVAGARWTQTWTTYPSICPALHWHQQLRRT